MFRRLCASAQLIEKKTVVCKPVGSSKGWWNYTSSAYSSDSRRRQFHTICRLSQIAVISLQTTGCHSENDQLTSVPNLSLSSTSAVSDRNQYYNKLYTYYAAVCYIILVLLVCYASYLLSSTAEQQEGIHCTELLFYLLIIKTKTGFSFFSL